MRSRPTIMQNNIRNPKLTMSDRLYRFDHPDSDIFLPRPLWSANICTLDNNSGHLRQINEQSDKSCFACQPIESNKSDCSANDCACSTSSSCNEQSCCKSCNEQCNCNCTNNADNTDGTKAVTDGEKTIIFPWPGVALRESSSCKAKPQSISNSNHQSGDTA